MNGPLEDFTETLKDINKRSNDDPMVALVSLIAASLYDMLGTLRRINKQLDEWPHE